MKKLYLSLTAPSLVGLMLSSPAIALPQPSSTNPIWNHTKQIQPSDRHALASTDRLMTRLTLALQEIDQKNIGAAQSNLLDADKLIGALKRENPEFLAHSFPSTFQKTHYGSGNDYFLPVADDVAVDKIYSLNQKRGNPEMQVRNTEVIDTTVQLDLDKVAARVRRAEALLKSNDGKGARAALAGIVKDAIVTQAIVQDPLFRVYSNLALAEDLMAQRDYPSARFSLESAQADLRKLESSKVLSRNDADARRLDVEIAHDQTALREDTISPTLSESVRAKLHHWMQEMRSWI